MTDKSYQNPHAQHERELAQTVARETVEILYGSAQQPNRRGGCLIVLGVAIVVFATYLIITGWLLMTITINITRHRHTYLHTITRDSVQGESNIIPRERAEEIIRLNCDGGLPPKCNLDAALPRHWSWEIEVEEEGVNA